jgi:hypothetical protein
MTGKDRQPEGHFGFARATDDGSADAPSPDRLVHPRSDGDPISTSSPAGLKRPGEIGAEPSPNTPDKSWVVRPKDQAPRKKKLSPFEMKASDIRMPGVSVGDEPGDRPTSKAGRTSKRWLALALAGMTYVVGAAGLWSMMQDFDDAMLLPITPAGDERAVPPLDETIDVRDAGLDGLIRPKPRPDDLRVPSDVADSNLQNSS